MCFGVAAMAAALFTSGPIHAETPLVVLFEGSYATGLCSYTSTDCSGTTGYIANRTKTVKVYAYASFSTNYFFYGDSSGSAYGSTVVSAYVGVAAPYTAIGTKADHVVIGLTRTWQGTSSIGYTD